MTETNSRLRSLRSAARMGGKRFVELYGNPGTAEGRAKGGRTTWQRRKADAELLKKYVKTFTEPMESEALAEFLGIILGDGTLTHFQCTIYLNSETDQEYARFVTNLIKQLFKLKTAVTLRKREKVLRITVSSVNFVQFLVKKGLLLGNKVRQQASVPDWIWSNSNYLKGCLRGLVDTDGCFAWHRYSVSGKEYSYPKIVFSNRSAHLLDFVSKALKTLGFNPKKTNYHQVWLYDRGQVWRYLQEIGTRNYKKSFFGHF